MSDEKTEKKPSKLESKRYLIIAIIGAVIVFGSIGIIKYGDQIYDPSRPPGVGSIGSDHVHAKFAILLDKIWVDTDPVIYPHYIKANDYIFLDERPFNFIHRLATGATLNMFFTSIGMELTDECFLFHEPTYDLQQILFTSDFCNEGDNKIKLYVNNRLNEENGDYVIKEGDNILIVYNDEDALTKDYG